MHNTILDIRLYNGSHECEGKLQLRSVSQNSAELTWFDVCSSQFGRAEARVVCRQLSCSSSNGVDRRHPSWCALLCIYDTHSIMLCAIGDSDVA